MSEWRPIETAPKEGQFLVTNEWDPEDPSYERLELVQGPFLKDGRVLNLNSGNYSRAGTWKWWMPVPTPPMPGGEG